MNLVFSLKDRLALFPALVARFPAFDIGCTFSRAWRRLHVYPRWAQVVCFPAFGTGRTFSRGWYRLYVFPRLAPDVCFTALGAGCMFSRARRRMYVFPSLAPVVCFPELGAGCMFSRPWRRLYVFPRLVLAPIQTGCLFCFEFCLVHCTVFMLGWTSRQQFEETWAALLGVISSPPLPDTVSTEVC